MGQIGSQSRHWPNHYKCRLIHTRTH
jgi:hypothetical protein